MQIAARVAAAWRVSIDAARGLRGVAATLGTAAAPTAPRPTIAILAGAPVARRGTESTYRVRLHNPAPSPELVSVTLVGSDAAGAVPDFRLDWRETLAPHASLECWIASTWTGAARFVDAPSADLAFVEAAAETDARWSLTATLAGAGGAAYDAARIEGVLLS